MHFYLMEYLKDENSELVMNVSSKHVPMHTRFPTILTVILYVGESKWNVAKRLIELEIIHPGFEGMFNEFKLNLIELNTN